MGWCYRSVSAAREIKHARGGGTFMGSSRSLACLSVRWFAGCPSYSWFYSATHPDLYKARSPKRTIIIRSVARRGSRHP